MLYAATIFLSAFLLFQIQPLIARIILPWFGGSAAVWTVCMLFFQLILLAGYLYAHGTIRFQAPRGQRLLHFALLIAAVAFLPLAPAEGWKPVSPDDPTWRILGLLIASVGLPYFVLSTTGPLAQAWYARDHGGASPYRLFALSNFASMLALLTYPLLVEPFIVLRWQTAGWSAGFFAFAVLCGALAWRTGTARVAMPAPARTEERPSLARTLLWGGLACCASVLLLAFTSHMSLNVAAIPFLWVVPLALYLLSFILCFEASGWYRRGVWLPVLGVGLALVGITLSSDHRNVNVWLLIPLYSGTLFAACMACHGELARIKPHPRHLTGFYLMIAAGGAAGGLLVGLVAPAVFRDLYELPLGMVALCLLVFAAVRSDRQSVLNGPLRWPAMAAFGLFVAALGGVLAYEYREAAKDVRVQVRNFYGVLTTRDRGTGPARERLLSHGTITHGRQYLDGERRRWPTSYYGPQSGVGLAIEQAGRKGPVRVGVVGLGTGTLAAYGRPRDEFRLYEINPVVLDIARNEFTYLKDSRAHLEVVLGDARLSLEGEPPQRFDVLALDAFSSDSIPVHLLTAEAFGAYLRHLKPGGVLAVHISNRYLDLAPVVQQAARQYGLEARMVENDDDEDKGVYKSDWVLLSTTTRPFGEEPLKSAVQPLEAGRDTVLWTDDYSNLFGILKIR